MKRLTVHVLAVRSTALLGAAALLAGCQSVGERMAAHATRIDACDARPLRAFVGRYADQATRDTIEKRVANVRQLRWIVPGEDVLADLQTGRINVVLDQKGTIKAVGCY